MRVITILSLAFAMLLLGALCTPVHAASLKADEPDTTLDEFLEEMSDSTDHYFGVSAAERDTAGLDSALAYALEHPDEQPQPRKLRIGGVPSFEFSRVDGPVWGGRGYIGDERRRWTLGSEVQYAVGPNKWLGGGSLESKLRRKSNVWSGRLWAGRRTVAMDREQSELILTTIRAVLNGGDRRHYFRRDGWQLELGRETHTSRVTAGYRDMLESPLATTTTWNLLKRPLAIVGNLPAARGRAHELEIEGEMRMPFAPVIAQITHQYSDGAIGSDFDYRRTRVAAGMEWGLGAFATLLPQVAYGRLTGDALPQQSFYLGGSHSVRSMRSGDRGGTGLALARLDVIGTHDILALAHIPHPAAVPIQAGLFAASGAVWGKDPFGGPPRAGGDWPFNGAWASEAGVSLIYQPGLPDPTSSLKLSYAWPLGPHRDNRHWTISFTRALDLMKRIGEPE